MKAPTGKLAFAYRTISELEAEVEALRTHGIPAGFYRELVALRELRDQVKAYVDGYLQDEIEAVECCVSEDQHLSASALSDRLNEAFDACWPPAMAAKEEV